MKICVITPRFTLTGVPLAQLRFARALASRGHDVDLVIGAIEPGLTVPASSGVRMIELGQLQVRKMIRPIAAYMRREQPDVIFSAEDHLTTIVLMVAVVIRSRAMISGSSRVSPLTTFSNVPLTKKWFLKRLLQSLFWRANALTCVSKDMVVQFRTVFKNPPHTNVYNIIDDAASRQRMLEAVDEEWLNDKQIPVIIAAGTLSWRKGFDDLVAAFGQVLASGRKARLLILGEGHKRAELESQIAELGISDHVKLPGYTTNALKYFSRADVFVLSSRFEGLPNVLIEAMVCGCTPVATDCPTGPREVLQDNRYGYLVPVGDRNALAAAIIDALDRPIAPELLAEAVRPFEESAVIARHFELLGIEAE